MFTVPLRVAGPLTWMLLGSVVTVVVGVVVGVVVVGTVPPPTTNIVEAGLYPVALTVSV